MTLLYKHQTLFVSLNYPKIKNLFFKSDWLITMLFQGQQKCWPRNMSHLVKSGSAWGCYLTRRNSLWRGSLLPCQYLRYHLLSQKKMENPKKKWFAFDPNTWTLKYLSLLLVKNTPSGERHVVIDRKFESELYTDWCILQWTRNTQR